MHSGAGNFSLGKKNSWNQMNQFHEKKFWMLFIRIKIKIISSQNSVKLMHFILRDFLPGFFLQITCRSTVKLEKYKTWYSGILGIGWIFLMIDSSSDFRIYNLWITSCQSGQNFIFQCMCIVYFICMSFSKIKYFNENHFRLAFGKHDNEQAVKNLD